MDTSALRYQVSWLLHALGFRQNPLRRSLDRLTAAVVIVLILVAVVAVPVSATLGNIAYEQKSQEAAQEAVTRQQVPAVLADNARTRVTGGDPASSATQTEAEVRWRGRDGQPRSAVTDVPVGSVRGSETMVWVDETDRLTTPPRNMSGVMVSAVFVAVWLLLALEAICFCLIAAVRRVASAYAVRLWAREWEVVELRWMRPHY